MIMMFTVEFADNETLTIFANSFDQAATLFVTYRSLQGNEPERFTIGRATLRATSDRRQREHMRIALNRREIGIGRYDPEEGWRVLPVIDADKEGTGAPWDP
jgi:hypothetical protein